VSKLGFTVLYKGESTYMLVAKHNTSNITTSTLTSSHKRAVNNEQKHFFITHKEMSTKCTTVHESNKSIGRGSIGKQIKTGIFQP